jgi:prepilin-type N-terminal cleavage/methylation domain-containing protein/prepilin-type processing-associated H-X9-DG protein
VAVRRRGRRTALRQHVHGFTLIEVVVVAGICGVLLALLLPAAGQLQASSRATLCANNLRQLHAAATAYSTMNDGHLPAALLHVKVGSSVQTVGWDFAQLNGQVSAGPVLTYLGGQLESFQCPSFHGSSTFGADPATGYNYNTSYLAAEGFLPKAGPDGTLLDGWNNCRLGVSPGELRRPSTCALFGDGGWKGGANKFMRAPSNAVEKNLGTVYAGGQAFRHAGCCNVVYLDGHCACVNRARPGALATPSLLETMMGWPENGFLSDDDQAYDPR